jgi:hypothetical protein
VIERQAGDSEEQENREAQHGKIRVQPAREMCEAPLPMQEALVLRRSARRINGFPLSVIGQFCGSQGMPMQSLRRLEVEIVLECH